MLKDIDHENFQLFDEPSQKNPACLFQVLRQLPIEATTITIPSFVLMNDNFSFLCPMRITGRNISGIGQLDASDINRKILEWFSEVEQVISNPHCQRAGKIYELILGRFSAAEKETVFNKLFALGLSDVGELNLTFAKYHKEGEEVFNIQNNIRFLQGRIEDEFFISLRVDVNNRNLKTMMEQREIERVWNFADTLIDTHLKGILNVL